MVKPRRFDVILEFRGTVWRRIPFEVSSDEAGAGDIEDRIASPTLIGFGLPTPDVLVGIALQFQVAQKLHAATDPHDPPRSVNDRPRDLVDLLLLRQLIDTSGKPDLADVRRASVAVFASRADEAVRLGYAARIWPPVVTAYDHWGPGYGRAASTCGIDLSLEEAAAKLNEWIVEIDREQQPNDRRDGGLDTPRSE